MSENARAVFDYLSTASTLEQRTARAVASALQLSRYEAIYTLNNLNQRGHVTRAGFVVNPEGRRWVAYEPSQKRMGPTSAERASWDFLTRWGR